MLLRNFSEGLNKYSAYCLDNANVGSFLHKSPTEGWEILDNIMKYTNFILRHEHLQEERNSNQEDLLAAESNPSPYTSLEIQPSMFSSHFEDDPSGNNKNTSNFFDAQLGEEASSIHTDQSQNLLTESSLNPTVPLLLPILLTNHFSRSL